MPGRDVQRKLGTTRGSPRRSRTAKASRISRHAVKSRCAREWGGWGRLSDDGPGQNNPDPSEGPWGRWSIPPHGGAQSSPQARLRAVPPMRPRGARRADANRSWPAYAGSRLKLDHHLGRRRLKGQPSSRTGENSPYGMIGGIEETSASFEARSAPRSYPTSSAARLCIAAVTKMLVRGVRSNPTATMSGTASDSHDSEAAHFRSVVPPQSAGTAHAHPRLVLLRASIVAMVVLADDANVPTPTCGPKR